MHLLSLALLAAFQDPEPADPKVKPREIKVVVTRVPMKITLEKFTSADALAKAHGKDVADAVAKDVNFKKEFVVVSAWSGSGGDRLEMTAAGTTATFTRTLGRTRDLRPHFKVFALPNGFTFKEGK